MRMASRMLLFIAVFLSGLPIAAFLADRLHSERVMVYVLIPWFVTFALLQFVLFRCPHCRKLAIITPGGLASPFVGGRCRYCGQDY